MNIILLAANIILAMNIIVAVNIVAGTNMHCHRRKQYARRDQGANGGSSTSGINTIVGYMIITPALTADVDQGCTDTASSVASAIYMGYYAFCRIYAGGTKVYGRRSVKSGSSLFTYSTAFNCHGALYPTLEYGSMGESQNNSP